MMENARADLLAIVGPTASGKSHLAMQLAPALKGEILCCDSMQVYRGMDIGTGKPSAAEQAAVPHHLLDLVDPGEPFHAAVWAEAAREIIGAVRGRGGLPLVVGGTGLYFRALTRGLFAAPPSDPAIRARHEEEAAREGIGHLQERLAQVDPEAAHSIFPNDLVRISRALEVFEQTGVPISQLRREAPAPPPLRTFTIVLDPPLGSLRTSIDRRVDEMMSAGFLEEVRRLREAGFGPCRALGGLGYRQLGLFLDDRIELVDAVSETKRATGVYARRQRTWFRGETADLRLTGRPAVDEILAALATWQATLPANP